MNVKELITKLLDYNMEAEVEVITDCYPREWSFSYGTVEGCTKANCDTVSFYVESPNNQEREG